MPNRILTDNKRLFRNLGIAFVIACFFEIILFNMGSICDIGLKPVTLSSDVKTDQNGIYVTDVYTADAYVHNVCVELKDITNAEYAEVTVSLTDEGDEYEYDLPAARVVPGIRGNGYIRIYPYGRVHDIRIRISVSEGAEASIGKISLNAHRPYDIKPLRLIILWIVLSLLIHTFASGYSIRICRGDKKQLVCIIVTAILMILIGRWLCTSNELLVACPWPHHKQYQDLAVALSEGTVKLKDLEVSEELLNKANPYDTIALMAEDIPYKMDYAYYNGSYYVYFGIIPELLLYYPCYRLTGRQLSNVNADFILYVLLVAGVFLCIRELAFRYGSRDREIPFGIYLLMCVTTCLFSCNVYLISRPDIYNIPIMAATAFTFTGLGLWLLSNTAEGIKRTVCLAAGSLCMACVAGCRPQMLIFSLAGIFLVFVTEDKDSGKLGIKDRIVFTRSTVKDTIALCLPYLLAAIPVCIYNYTRFGNILDFGATYSLTTNDMNHRGFNVDRLIRGLYCFFFQPPVMTTDFPYIGSSVIDSAYMGKNPTEFTYGGAFVTNLLLCSVFVPLFAKVKALKREASAVILTLLGGSLVIAAFDVNGAGMLYRYTCDMMPGLIIAAMIVWIALIGDGNGTGQTAVRVFAVLAVCALIYSFMVFTGPSGSLALKDTSIRLYENIRQYFRF